MLGLSINWEKLPNSTSAWKLCENSHSFVKSQSFIYCVIKYFQYLEAPPLKPSCYAKKSSHSESFHSDDDVEVWNSAEDFEAVFLSRVLVEELDENVVGHWDERLNLFEKLIFVKLFLEEKVGLILVDNHRR